MNTRDGAWPDGSPCWADLSTSDPESAWRFYGSVMGWQIVDQGEQAGHYGIVTVADRAVAGIGPAQPGLPTAWTVYLASSDVDRTAEAVTAAGGSLLVEPTPIGEQGRMAVAQDPTGAVFGLWQAGRRTGAEITGEPGSMIWHDLMTHDPGTAREFYHRVFGWTHLPVDGGMDYSTVPGVGDDVMICGIGAMTEDVPTEVPAHWRVYFGVIDADATVETALDGGGQVQMESSDTPYGRMAVLSDPQGGSFVIVGNR